MVAGEGVSGRVIATRRPVRTAACGDDPGIGKEFPHVAPEEEIAAAMVVPIIAGGALEGLIYVANRLPRAFTEQDEAILVRLADHVAIAIANAELYRAAGERERLLQALTHQLTTAQEAERKRLSQEIHDELGQALTAIKISLKLLSDDLGDRDETASARIDAATSAVQTALQEVRRIASDLRPYVLDFLGLGPALRCHVDRFSMLTGIAVELSLEGRPGRLDPDAETLLYRVTQEALTNAARHAGATRVWCRLRHRESLVELTITDDGRGFDPAAVLRSVWKEGRLGLVGIKERVERMGGTLVLAAAPGGGTRLTVELPRSTSGSSAAARPSEVSA
jgi:signal transduction histidine kinase